MPKEAAMAGLVIQAIHGARHEMREADTQLVLHRVVASAQKLTCGWTTSVTIRKIIIPGFS